MTYVSFAIKDLHLLMEFVQPILSLRLVQHNIVPPAIRVMYVLPALMDIFCIMVNVFANSKIVLPARVMLSAPNVLFQQLQQLHRQPDVFLLFLQTLCVQSPTVLTV